MSSNKITLEIDGRELDKAWSDISVKRSMEGVCSSFTFTTVQKTPNFKIADWPIQFGSLCKVLVDGEKVLTGYIEDIDVSYDKDTHTVSVSGRDRTCDLVDCHRADDPFEFGTKDKVTVLNIVKSICKPFNITVTVDPSAQTAASTLKSSFYIMPGDVNIGALYKITRWARLYMMATTDGGLLLTMAGSRRASAELKLGVNILKGGLKGSDKEKFSVYRVRGYGTSSDNKAHSKEWLWMNGRFPPSDPVTYPDLRTGATRYRPFGQNAEIAVQIDNVGNMSKADAQYRLGNSRKFNYQVAGWRELTNASLMFNPLWTPNTLIYVSDSLTVNEPKTKSDRMQLLIESVNYTQTDQGSKTDLGLCFPDKYTALAEVNRIKTIFDQGPK